MKNNLLVLIELQKVDNELQTLEELKGDLPQKVRELKEELSLLTQNSESQKRDLEETKRLRFHWDGELKVLQDKLNKYRDQLYAVKSNREYDAITVEIEGIEKKIDETETKALELIEKEDGLSEAIKNSDSQIAGLNDNLVTKEHELQQKISKTEDEYKVWQTKRGELLGQIKRPILATYERIRKVKGRNTVAELNKYACGGCYSAIPPQKAMEIRTMDQLILCESCGRILIYLNENEVVTS
ncbi:MAG TPA: C4-type zinc ribbon domain-containing protein [bacterium]